MSSENQSHLLGLFNREEERAESEITPAMLCELIAGGNVQPHSTEGGRAERMFAEVDGLQGANQDTAYAAESLVALNIEYIGSETQAWLKVGEDVDIGDELISAGDGTLIKNGNEDSSTTVVEVIAIAREAKDLSVSGAVVSRIRVRVCAG